MLAVILKNGGGVWASICQIEIFLLFARYILCIYIDSHLFLFDIIVNPHQGIGSFQQMETIRENHS